MFTIFDHQHIETLQREPRVVHRDFCESTDSELMEGIQAGDERALETLIRRFQSLVRSVVERMIPSDHDVSDVIEEVFLSIWKQAANFDSLKCNPIGWIITIARRRTSERAELRYRISSETGTTHFAGDDVEKSALKSEMASMFQKLLSTLPIAQSAVVRMAFYRGLSHREIARETGIPLGTVKTRIELGIKKLRAAVSAFGSRDKWLFGTGSWAGLRDPSL
jgi:RNA polymerase sigma-70 factor (ECF subfamily)